MQRTDDGYSTSIYAKYMFYENKTKTGGAAIKAGTGLFPGTLDGEARSKDAFKTYWMNAPVTIPFLKNTLQWDIMPGASMTRNYGTEETTAFGFTYSTRVAWYPFNEKGSIVAELFGAAGEAHAIPEFKIGWRWEPSQYAVFALTYGQGIQWQPMAQGLNSVSCCLLHHLPVLEVVIKKKRRRKIKPKSKAVPGSNFEPVRNICVHLDRFYVLPDVH